MDTETAQISTSEEKTESLGPQPVGVVSVIPPSMLCGCYAARDIELKGLSVCPSCNQHTFCHPTRSQYDYHIENLKRMTRQPSKHGCHAFRSMYSDADLQGDVMCKYCGLHAFCHPTPYTYEDHVGLMGRVFDSSRGDKCSKCRLPNGNHLLGCESMSDAFGSIPTTGQTTDHDIKHAAHGGTGK